MSGYLKNIAITEQFDGDTVNVAMRPVELGALLGVRAAAAGGEVELAKEFQRLLPLYIVTMDGLKDADGQPVDVATLCSAAYFGPLLMAIGSRWLEEAVPKNGQPPSAP